MGDAFGFVVVHNEDPVTVHAVEELLEQAAAAVAGRRVRGILLLAGIDHDHRVVVAGLRAAYPEAALIGCTTDGEMSSVAGFCEDSLLAMLLVGEGLRVAAGLGHRADRDPVAAVDEALGVARQGLGVAPRLCLTTPESLTCDATALIAALRGQLGDSVPVIGGTAGDGWRFQRSYQFCGDEVVSDAIPVLLIAGELELSFGVASGWAPLGAPSVVTEVAGNVVARIGDQSAIEFYDQRLGDHVSPSGEHPLAVFVGDGDDHYLRAPVGYDLEAGSIVFAGAIPAGARVQISAADREAIIAASERSVRDALAAYPGGTPSGALLISCAARKLVLGTRAAGEQALLREVVLAELPFLGFYAYGELSPPRRGEATLFHNETFVTVLLGPRVGDGGAAS